MPKGVYERTEEVKNILRNYRKGVKHSEETKRKIGAFSRGKKLSEETRRKMSKSSTGKYHSEETKRKISEIHKGKKGLVGSKNPMYGKYHSLESCRKMSEAHKGKPNGMLGKKLSEETKRKMSESRKGKKFSEKHRKNLSEALRGEKGGNWKGGITPLYKQVRNCFNYRRWRSSVFERDNWICQTCEQRGGKLEAHHFVKSLAKILREKNIKRFQEAIDCRELWDVTNGVTLCLKCHDFVHKKSKFRS